jgi:5-methylcytosine-specific restriction enzyme B
MPKEIRPLETAISNFSKAAYQEHFEAGERERAEILARFPLEDWPELSLERYALGMDEPTNTYCWWLEFGSPHLGSIKGGSAAKLLIYKHKTKPGWYFQGEYEDEQQAWQAVRAAFLHAFQLAQAGEWEQIDEIQPLMGARALRLKTLHIYFPESILAVFSTEHMRHFLKRLGVYRDEMNQWEAGRLNRYLLQSLQQIPGLSGWENREIERFLYYWADPRESRRILKIAPGENARLWQDCREGSFICVGWDDTGNLQDFENKEAFKEHFSEVYKATYKGHLPMLTKKSREVWTLMELEPGDIIVANNGISKILAVGEVVEPGYVWRPERDEYKHTVSVKWDESYAQEIVPQQKWAFTTVDAIPVTLYQQIISAKPGKKITPLAPVEPIFLEIADALSRKGQAILYGPPGTGKTYIARRFAVWWLAQSQNAEKAQGLLIDPQAFASTEKKLRTSMVAKRVWWVVANPKEWSWERLFEEKLVEFRYGRFQRNYPLVRPGDLVVGYQSRPDQRVMALGEITRGMHESERDGPQIEIKYLEKINNGITYSELQNDPILKFSEPMRNRCQGTLFALTGEEAQYLLEIIAEAEPNIDKFVTSGEGIGYLTWLTFHPSYSYEDFVEGFRPVDTGTGGLTLRLEDGIFKRLCREAQAHPKENYLIVIDEINRANLAKVFGELITLLEQDKRGLEVSLPQSKESFTIPPNIYLLGTMNTADRSIKLLDAALRRRFSFIELMPDLSLLHGAKVNELALDDFLEGLNQRIAENEGREKQIGHAFLLENGQPVKEPAEFARRFRQEVLPLLQEYCYEDYSTLANYLGDQLVNRQAQSLNSEIINDDEALIEALARGLNQPGS